MRERKAAGRGLLVFLLLPLFASGADNKEKKAYELIYEDVQLLKRKLALVETKLDQNAEDIRALQAQVKDFIDQWKLAQGAQAGLKEDLKALPSQYQVLADKLELISLQLARVSEDLLTLRPAAAAAATPETAGPNKADKKEPDKKPEPDKAAKEAAGRVASPLTNLSPQEVYNTAYTDYLKGNFDLATEGFRIYREQFQESPLADNALYWIGECSFSQKKFEEAIGHLDEMILNYPQSDKIAAAYLKKGLSLMEMGRKEEAISVFKLLVGKFPLENETKVAQQKIKDLISEDERY
ncbi:MAG: tetratricopeptide repeat protein [Candidatus Aminicenantes bacterium]|jgi:tol-pal system protein YbgF|nr:tetratricopeptide repeat protein [Candidatus Aminicenantes bacterium]